MNLETFIDAVACCVSPAWLRQRQAKRFQKILANLRASLDRRWVAPRPIRCRRLPGVRRQYEPTVGASFFQFRRAQ